MQHDISLAGPNFLFGADYEDCVRLGTSLRWGGWTSPLLVSLAMHPPQPPASGMLELEDVLLAVGRPKTWPQGAPGMVCR